MNEILVIWPIHIRFKLNICVSNTSELILLGKLNKILVGVIATFFSFSVGYTQTGPGGIPTTSLSMWLNPSDLNLANGDPVATWTDASGNGNTATQPSANKRPSFVTSSNLNGMPAVSFSGGSSNTTSDNLEVADNSNLDNSQGLVFYAVCRQTSAGSPGVQGIFGKRKDYNTAASWAYNWYFYTGRKLFIDLNTSNNRHSTADAFSNGVNYLLSLHFNGHESTASQRVRHFVSGSLNQTGTETSTTILNSNEKLYIGTMNNNYGQYYGGLMGDLMIFNDTLSTTRRILIDNYLSAKYNTSLTSSDLYTQDDSGNGDFDYDVAGIGQNTDGTSNTDAIGTGIVRINSANSLDNGDWLIWGHDNGALNSWAVVDTPVGVQARLAREWRVSETGEVGTITISFDLSDVFGSKTATDLRLLIDTDNDGSFSDETVGTNGVISGATNTGGDTYEWTSVNLNNNQRFTIGSINESQTPLPVSLVTFKATKDPNENIVHLMWITASEVNNDYFTVEKTKDLSDFELVEIVPGAGTSNSEQEYHVNDYSPYNTVSYYRLSQTDYNGQETFFPMEKIELSEELEIEMALYPNPASRGQNIYIRIPKNSHGVHEVLINDLIGKSHAVDITSIDEGESSLLIVELDQTLSPGTYLIQIESNEKVYSHSIIIR